MFYGPMSGVQLSYGINLGTYQTHDPIGYQSHLFVSKWATHLWVIFQKQVFDDTYLWNLLYYKQISSMGHHVVLNYPRVSFKVTTTLMTSYIYRIVHNLPTLTLVYIIM
jgi:hypothetical protein